MKIRHNLRFYWFVTYGHSKTMQIINNINVSVCYSVTVHYAVRLFRTQNMEDCSFPNDCEIGYLLGVPWNSKNRIKSNTW